ncbi:hypothetical protein Agabi119p4_4921 [Agaricus bisporus var. burnettii]|uniref:Uncharacterized protein n=1 Tax=Agaricus bisporus var. burnettii TaxID=192524 RepID=A0A8H7F4C9_AGABI|nr:hypothetical protein Agabi119p4_4921 [Agaricus bisporus var. burnettii]
MRTHTGPYRIPECPLARFTPHGGGLLSKGEDGRITVLGTESAPLFFIYAFSEPTSTTFRIFRISDFSRKIESSRNRELAAWVMPSARHSSAISSFQELATLNKSALRSSSLCLYLNVTVLRQTQTSRLIPPHLPFRVGRQTTSSVTLDESVLSRSSLSLNNASESPPSTSKPSSQDPPVSRNHVQSSDQAEFEPSSPQTDNPNCLFVQNIQY